METRDRARDSHRDCSQALSISESEEDLDKYLLPDPRVIKDAYPTRPPMETPPKDDLLNNWLRHQVHHTKSVHRRKKQRTHIFSNRVAPLPSIPVDISKRSKRENFRGLRIIGIGIRGIDLRSLGVCMRKIFIRTATTPVVPLKKTNLKKR